VIGYSETRKAGARTRQPVGQQYRRRAGNTPHRLVHSTLSELTCNKATQLRDAFTDNATRSAAAKLGRLVLGLASQLVNNIAVGQETRLTGLFTARYLN